MLASQEDEIRLFDEKVWELKSKYTIDELITLGYTDKQIDGIKNFDGTDNQRLKAAAISTSNVQINANYYSKGYSNINYTYIVDFKGTSIIMGAGGTLSAGTGIKSSGYYQRTLSSISGMYTSNGKVNGSNKTFGGHSKLVTNGDSATYVLPGTKLLSNGEYVYLSRLSLNYEGKAQGNHTLNNILAATARKGIAASSVGISFSGTSMGLSFSISRQWKEINRWDKMANR